ncbi:putative monooxygenase [Pseudovibrio axinellae]|uniref:Putative monooxygenase n=1 Tax=Pseudovibrio axinellae TaxID=989403 RepID=A0A166ADB7_9HYPH|nr:putative quinol monooxygenase [Pseudovibrio axinellae]KZL20920.1 putative monooxygenase [Pseudovibrio axinellae]SEP83033.1 Quinol monooxygenase YgiN [Pseudovibrio axinellae]
MLNSLFIFAEITPKPEHYKDAQQAIIGILERTRAEAGCLVFDLFQSPDQDTLYLYEKWTDQNALDQHHAQPYTAAVFKSYQTWLAKPPRILPMNSVT